MIAGFMDGYGIITYHTYCVIHERKYHRSRL
jgi:hypothetical protein